MRNFEKLAQVLATAFEKYDARLVFGETICGKKVDYSLYPHRVVIQLDRGVASDGFLSRRGIRVIHVNGLELDRDPEGVGRKVLAQCSTLEPKVKAELLRVAVGRRTGLVEKRAMTTELRCKNCRLPKVTHSAIYLRCRKMTEGQWVGYETTTYFPMTLAEHLLASKSQEVDHGGSGVEGGQAP